MARDVILPPSPVQITEIKEDKHLAQGLLAIQSAAVNLQRLTFLQRCFWRKICQYFHLWLRAKHARAEMEWENQPQKGMGKLLFYLNLI